MKRKSAASRSLKTKGEKTSQQKKVAGKSKKTTAKKDLNKRKKRRQASANSSFEKKTAQKIKNKKPKKPVKKKDRFSKKKNQKKKLIKTVGQQVRDFILVLISLAIVILLISSFFVTITKVSGYSMTSTLRDNDTLFVRKTKAINRMDLIVFERRNQQEIRRVIGLPGERIDYQADVLYVDGEIVNEGFLADQINEAQRNQGQYTKDFKMQALTGEAFVPDDCYFVLGDNREWAVDSREYGFVKADQIIGVIKMRLLPINNLAAF